MEENFHLSAIGVAYCGGKQPFTFAALDERQKVQALGTGKMCDALAYCSGAARAVILCGLPLCRPASGNLRLVEIELERRGLPTYHTAAEDQPHHPAAGFGARFSAELSALGYSSDPLNNPDRVLLESHPAAIFHHLLGLKPFDAHTLEGRLQRQLVLFEREMPIPDPMDFFEEVTRHKLLHGILPTRDVYSPAELDALALAHTAWLFINDPQSLLILGDPASGQILLPQPH